MDTKTQDTLDIELGQLAKHFDFFLPWAGMEKMVYRGENPADVKAAEKMADFFDHIKATNYPANVTKEQLHDLVVFLNRLLFCFFAEDTKIFSENQFTNLLSQHTQEDGIDLHGVFERLFYVLNTPAHQRNDLPKYLNDFPYVNGGLFKHQIRVPSFDAKARRMLLDSGQLDWADINPDIFGSMIQGVSDPETRSKMGMHYTSVSNIMKVIEPLFLNDLYDEFDKCNDNINKLKKLQVRLSRIKFFDPACGSGNFLIITYKEIRLLEIELLKRIRELEQRSDFGSIGLFDESHSAIRLDQFYGIELDDFAHEMAILSLWLVEHQMNMVFETEFGYTAPTLPLKQSGRIVAGNAALIDWEIVCPALDNDEVYILSNPPYLGARMQSKEHKSHISAVFGKKKGANSLDYISIWFEKASLYCRGKVASYSFVSTNSICQGEQVALLWKDIIEREQEISFCHLPFKWQNSAKANAAVIVIIVGVSNAGVKEKYIYNNYVKKEAAIINPYLKDTPISYVYRRSEPLSNIPQMAVGNMPLDGGNLILDESELPDVKGSDEFIYKFVGAQEFLQGKKRWTIWIEDEKLKQAEANEFIRDRIEKTREFRLSSSRDATRELANKSHKYGFISRKEGSMIIVPKVSSERRNFIPIAYLDESYIASDLVFCVYDAPIWLLTLLSSSLHMSWVRVVAGRLKSDYRYSSAICYNTFPVPQLSEESQNRLTELGIHLLEVREEFPEKTLSELYDPNKMPYKLKVAHEEIDIYVDMLFGIKGNANEEIRQKHLFEQFRKLTR
ncbi:DNA methyltransferase [Escherichia coli]|uniref:DNA methyltransferase n=1 Tax=Escherichia coli TaxID=562 RepID=UPI0032E4848C